MKYWLIFLFLIPISLSAQDDFRDLLQKQNNLLDQKKYSAVIDLAANLSLQPNSSSDSTAVVSIYLNSALAYFSQEEFESAIVVADNILPFLSSALISDHKKSRIFCLLGDSYKQLSHYLEAENWFIKAFEIIDQHPEFQDRFILYSLQNYGRVLQSLIKYHEAELIYQRAIKLSRQSHPETETMTAVCQSALGQVYAQEGKYDRAGEIYLSIINSNQKLVKKNGFTIARTYNDLADLYAYQKKYDLAEKYLLKYSDIIDGMFGYNSVENSYRLFFLGRLYSQMGQYQKADSLLLDCLKIRQGLKQMNEVQMSHTYFRLGSNALLMKQYDRAEKYLLHALDIRKRRLGPFHPNVFQTYQKLGNLYAATGRDMKAVEYYDNADQARKSFFEYTFSSTSENQKLNYISIYPPVNHALLTLARDNHSVAAMTTAYTNLLNGKNLVINALMAEKEIAYCNFEQKDLDLYQKRNEIRTDIAHLFLTQNDNSLPLGDTINSLIAYQDSLEADLSRSCSIFRKKIKVQDYRLDDVVGALPENSVLFDFIKYHPFDLAAPDKATVSSYLVFVIDKNKKPRLIDLGSAEKIDSLIIDYCALMEKAHKVIYLGDISENEKQLNKIGYKLFQKIMLPLNDELDSERPIFIAPDGLLNLLPFYTLIDEHKNYLIEKYNIINLTSAKDLINGNGYENVGSKEAIIFADPDYDAGKAEQGPVSDILMPTEFNCLNAEFPLLRYSWKEAVEVVDLLHRHGGYDVSLYFGENASEIKLKSITTPPYLLHISTHGYYCDQTGKLFDNPLLNSALVLAGVNSRLFKNTSKNTQIEDGILTAYEVSGLNLSDCELVVLSACESGAGELSHDNSDQHEGVYGLRRAFRHAGAKSILFSLWNVPDKETFELISRFYQSWLRGATKTESIHKAMLKTLEEAKINHNSTHPIFWGGFMLVGEPD